MINELLFILVLLLSFLVAILAIKLGKGWLIAVPPIYLVFANIFAPQLITVFGLVTSLAVPLYAAIFLATDVVAEHWGKKEARKIIWIGLVAQIMLVLFSQIMIRADVLEPSLAINEAFQVIFSFTPRLVLGSLVAYVISQNWDIFVFHSLKKKTEGRHLWLRNNLSTATSQLLDSFIVIFIAFYGVLPGLVQFALTLWATKIIVALLDTPIIYMSYGILGKKRPSKLNQ